MSQYGKKGLLSERCDEETLKIHLHNTVQSCVEICDLVLNEKHGDEKNVSLKNSQLVLQWS